MPYYPTPPAGKPPEKRRPDRKLLRWTILAVSLFLIGYGSVKLAFYVHDSFSARRITRELRETVERMNEAAASETTAPPSVAAEAAGMTCAANGRLPEMEYPQGLDVVPGIRELRKKSDYILGWISMEDLEEPVVRKDNTFFLNHDAMGNRNRNGAIFMDERTSLLTRPYTILLYGHNMKTGAMFGSLRKYEEYSYFFRHRFFRLDTLFEEGQYVIFAVERIQLTPGTGRYLDLNALASDDREIRKNALDTLIRHSMHPAMLDVNEEDQLVLLITCVGEDDERLIVAARRLREEEDFPFSAGEKSGIISISPPGADQRQQSRRGFQWL